MANNNDDITSLADTYENLLKNPAYVSNPTDAGRLVYEYSNAYTELDMSTRRKKQVRKSLFSILLLIFSALLVIWYFTSLIYGLVTENSAVNVILMHLLPLFVVGICIAIFLMSYFGVWGKFFRLTYRPHYGSSAWFRRHNAEVYSSMKQADSNLSYQTTIAVTENYVLIWLYGIQYTFDKSLCRARIEIAENIDLTLIIGNDELKFPLELPKGDIYKINRAFKKKTEIIRADSPKDTDKKRFGGHSLGDVISGTIVACIIISGGGVLIALSLTTVPSLPAFLGIVLIGFGALALCNVFHHITFVPKVLLPLAVGLTLTVGAIGLLFFVEEELTGESLTIISLLTHCTAIRVGCIFFIFLGLYAVAFAISEAVRLIKYK